MTPTPDARPISADSHVVEGPGVFAGLVDRFGDEAPRLIQKEGRGDHIVIPAARGRGVNVGMMALAATRLDYAVPVERRKGHKPGTGTVDDPEIRAYLERGERATFPNP